MEPPIVVFLLCLVWTLSALSEPKNSKKYEYVGRESSSSNPVAAAIARGYNTITRVTGQPFYVTYWSNDYLVLPAKYLPDVRRAHRDHLSFVDSVSDLFFMYNWIGDLFKSSRMVFAVMRGINPQLHNLSTSLFEESSYACEKEIGELEESRQFITLNLMTSISLRVMTRIIAGTELSRDETFLDAMGNYFSGNFLTGLVMLKLPITGRARDLIAWPLWKFHQVFNQSKVLKMIKPVVAKRMETHKHGGTSKDQFDAITCTLNLLNDYPLDEESHYTPIETLSHETLQLIWAAGQSPAMSITTVIFKLLEFPEYLEPMRREAQAAIDAHGWNDPIFSELPRIDSFIRETHRLSPAFSLNATRAVRGQPFTFSDGLTLPVGTRIAFPAEAIQRDPNIVEDPDTFDGFRFVKLAALDKRQEDGVNRWHSSHCGFSNLIFGYGNHACPGRFIAIRLIKVLMCRFLLQYNLEWDHGGGEPPKFVIEGACVPNLSQKVTVTRRVGV